MHGNLPHFLYRNSGFAITFSCFFRLQFSWFSLFKLCTHLSSSCLHGGKFKYNILHIHNQVKMCTWSVLQALLQTAHTFLPVVRICHIPFNMHYIKVTHHKLPAAKLDALSNKNGECSGAGLLQFTEIYIVVCSHAYLNDILHIFQRIHITNITGRSHLAIQLLNWTKVNVLSR